MGVPLPPASDDIDVLLEWAIDFSTERQLRLFACACCRRIWHLMSDERSRKAVECAEMFANGDIDPDALQRKHRRKGCLGTE